METERLSKLVLQAAETSRLLGVGFVPMYGDHALPAEGADPGPVSPTMVPPPPPAPRLSPAAPELLPMPPFPPRSMPVIEIKPRSRKPDDVQAALDALRARYESDAPHKQFVTAHHNIVFGEGDPCARVMFVGEAPGQEEDRTGRPFVGRAGQLLDKMITAMGLSREHVYIANVLKTRPPDNATPTSEEARLCAPYLFTQIAIVRPEAIVTLGLPATRTLLDTVDSMSRLRGRWASFQPPWDGPIPVMPTYHPAFLLRSYTEENRQKVWSDLKQVIERLGLSK